MTKSRDGGVFKVQGERSLRVMAAGQNFIPTTSVRETSISETSSKK